MKRVSLSVILSLLAIFVLIGSAFAAANALPGSGWWSGEQIQNVGSSDATIDITAYDSASSATFGLTDTITPGAAKNYLPGAFAGMPSGFQGSAIVSSNQDIRAIVNVTNRYNAGLGLGDSATPHAAGAQYQGMNVPNTTIQFPLAKNNHFSKTTSFFIQNAGSVAAPATATFKLPNGGVVTTYTYTTPAIGPGQMVVVTPNDARDAGSNPPPSGNGVIGSLTVTSSQLLAGTVLEHFTVETHATLLQSIRAATANDYDTKLYAPIIKNNYFGRFTGLQIQNVSSGPVNITVNYVGGDTQSGGVSCIGQTYTDTHNSLPPGESWTFFAYASTVTPAIPDKCLLAGTATATGNVIGETNEAFTTAYITANGVYQEATAYNTLPNNSATNFLSVPLYKEDSISKTTAAVIQNVGTSDTNVVLTFKGVINGTPMTFISQPQLIHAGASVVFLNVRLKGPSFWNGTEMTPALLGCVNDVAGCGNNGIFGLVVKSDGQPIIAIAQESTYPISTPRVQQDKANYEGFNLLTAP